MRFLIMVKGNKETESGRLPKDRLIAAMATYHEELARAGVLLDASGLQPTSKGWRVRYSRAKRTVTSFHSWPTARSSRWSSIATMPQVGPSTSTRTAIPATRTATPTPAAMSSVPPRPTRAP